MTGALGCCRVKGKRHGYGTGAVGRGGGGECRCGVKESRLIEVEEVVVGSARRQRLR